jgi:hypothetical protein
MAGYLQVFAPGDAGKMEEPEKSVRMKEILISASCYLFFFVGYCTATLLFNALFMPRYPAFVLHFW